MSADKAGKVRAWIVEQTPDQLGLPFALWTSWAVRASVSLMPPLVNLSSLIDDAKCYELVRQHRWPEGARCPACDSAAVTRHGRDDTQPYRQRYRCTTCGSRFDDLTGTVLAGHHQPLRVWVLCLYFMGLNLSNRQITRGT